VVLSAIIQWINKDISFWQAESKEIHNIINISMGQDLGK